MKGAIAVPSVKTIKVPNRSKKKTIGANQNFFRTLKNSQNSVNIVSLDILKFHVYCFKIAFHMLGLFKNYYHDYSNMKK